MEQFWLIVVVVGIVVVLGNYLFSQGESDKIARIQEKHDPDMSGLGAKVSNWSAMQRANLRDTLNRETTGVLTSQTLVDDYNRDRTLKNAQVEDTLRELETKWNLMHHAATAYDRPLDVPTYLGVERTRITDELEVSKKRAFNEADLDNTLAEMRERVRLAIIAKHLTEHQKVAAVIDLLDTMYRQVEDISQSSFSPQTKRRMIADREETIATFQEHKRGIEARLLETGSRRVIRGVDEDTALR